MAGVRVGEAVVDGLGFAFIQSCFQQVYTVLAEGYYTKASGLLKATGRLWKQSHLEGVGRLQLLVAGDPGFRSPS